MGGNGTGAFAVRDGSRAPGLPQGRAVAADLRAQLRQQLAGRVCLLGLGNEGLGDDGFGVRLAEALQAAGLARAHAAGPTPERWLAGSDLDAVDNLVFLDAVEFGGTPGAVVFLDAGQMASRFPQVSTHKLSLGLLAKCAEANGQTRAWLLGAQPASLRPGAALSPAVQLTLELLKDLLCEVLEAAHELGWGRLVPADNAGTGCPRPGPLRPVVPQLSTLNPRPC